MFNKVLHKIQDKIWILCCIVLYIAVFLLRFAAHTQQVAGSVKRRLFLENFTKEKLFGEMFATGLKVVNASDYE